MKCHSLYTLGGLAINASKHYDYVEAVKENLVKKI